MDLDQACGVKDPGGIPWAEKYDRYIAHIGRDAIRTCLPAGIPELAAKYIRDEHLNNIPLSEWERAAGYPKGKRHPDPDPPKASGSFPRLLMSKGVTCFSSSEAVSLLKRCAELEAKDYIARMLAAKGRQEPETLEIWAVFEHCRADPDKFNRHNIFDFDCIDAFLDEQDAIRCELGNPGRRVRKLVRYRYIKQEGGSPDAV